MITFQILFCKPLLSISTKNDKVKVNTVKKINTRSNEQWLYGQNQLPKTQLPVELEVIQLYFYKVDLLNKGKITHEDQNEVFHSISKEICELWK